MKAFLLSSILFLSIIMFGGCATQQYPYPKTDLTQENWQKAVVTQTKPWLADASTWFLTGEPAQMPDDDTAAANVVTTSRVRVGKFDEVKVAGDFEVQLFGTSGPNSVFIYGPNAGVRYIAVEQNGKQLVVSQMPHALPVTKKVIVRIGVKKLHHLTQAGCGAIAGRALHSDHLSISSLPGGDGNIYLSGDINLQGIEHASNGNLYIFNTISPRVDIISKGSGNININGKVGVRHITHLQGGDINIVGAASDDLAINAQGTGKISILGVVNLTAVAARGNTWVYGYHIKSNNLHVSLSDRAQVGLAGKVRHLEITSSGLSRFYGRYLHAKYVRIRSTDSSHINVTANKEIFAAADGMSTMYYFGPPERLDKFISQRASIIAI